MAEHAQCAPQLLQRLRLQTKQLRLRALLQAFQVRLERGGKLIEVVGRQVQILQSFLIALSRSMICSCLLVRSRIWAATFGSILPS